MCFFVQTNHTRKELLFLMFKEINLRNHSSLHKLFYSLEKRHNTMSQIGKIICKYQASYLLSLDESKLEQLKAAFRF